MHSAPPQRQAKRCRWVLDKPIAVVGKGALPISVGGVSVDWESAAVGF